jgi:hypothetical protein
MKCPGKQRWNCIIYQDTLGKSKKYFHKEDADLHDIAHYIAHVHVNIKASEINSEQYQSFPG